MEAAEKSDVVVGRVRTPLRFPRAGIRRLALGHIRSVRVRPALLLRARRLMSL